MPRHDPLTTDLLAHCETFQRQSWIRKGDSKAESATSYGIASVYTPSNHRGKGYARQLLQLIHYLIASPDLLPPFPEAWGPKPDVGPKNAAFSVLYSGIGDKFYASCRQGEGSTSKDGWIRQPVTTRTWDITGIETEDTPAGWEWLGVDDLTGVETDAAESLWKQVSEADPVNGGLSFDIAPTW